VIKCVFHGKFKTLLCISLRPDQEKCVKCVCVCACHCSGSPLLNFSHRRIHTQTHTCTGLIEAGLKVALQREDITYLRIARMILGTHLTFVPVKCFREQNVVSLVSVHLSACKSSCASNNACACACACVCECVRACVRACNTAVPSPLLNVCLGVLGLALWGSMGEACADFYW
jgi:hypothetical protein